MNWGRGKCDPAVPGNMGKMMRSHIVRQLREGIDRDAPADRPPEINACCHGTGAEENVTLSPWLPIKASYLSLSLSSSNVGTFVIFCILIMAAKKLIYLMYSCVLLVARLPAFHAALD